MQVVERLETAGTAFRDEHYSDQDVAPTPPVSENPYASPQLPQTHAPQANPEVLGGGRGLGWLLLSLRGRIPRRIYWGASLSVTLVFYALLFLLVETASPSPVIGIAVLVLYSLLLWTSFAITVKRWHDRDKSGVWVLIGLIPILGPIWTFIEVGCLRGTYGDNRYGPDPT